MDDGDALRKFAVNVFDGSDRGSERISVITMIKGIQKCSVFSDQCCFGGRRTCINPEIGIAAVAGKIPHRNLMLCMALLEFQIVCLGGKKRFHTFYFEFHLDF